MSLRSIRACPLGISLFRLVDEIWKGPTGKATLHRICTMTRWMGVESVVIENVDNPSLPEHSRLQREFNAIERRLGRTIRSEAFKLTFLRSKITPNDKADKTQHVIKDASNDMFLGYVIVVNLSTDLVGVRQTYVFEAIVRDLFSLKTTSSTTTVRPETLPAHHLHVRKCFLCSVLDGEKTYKILGTFFSQQNTWTNVCAHAATLMMLNNCSEISDLISCEDVNEILEIDHTTKAIVVENTSVCNDNAVLEGIETNELKKVFSHYGFRSDPYSFALHPNETKFRHFMYSYIESGYPALLSFQTQQHKQHVMAVVGHTWNAHSWLPHAFPCYLGRMNYQQPYLSTLSWINDLIVHDDNFGMQLCLPAHALLGNIQASQNENTRSRDGLEPIEAIGIFPVDKGVRLLPYLAEGASFRILRKLFRKCGPLDWFKNNYYVGRLWDHMFPANFSPTVVLRTSLVDKGHYLAHLELADSTKQCYSPSSLERIAHVINKDNLLLIEVSEPDLYIGNLSKVIDIVMDPEFEPPIDGEDQNEYDVAAALMAVRFPEFLLIPKEFRRSYDITYEDPIPLPCVKGHLPLCLLPSAKSIL